MKKKTMSVLLTILLLSVYGISAYAKQGGNPFDEIWGYINTLIDPTLADHEARIAALEESGSGEQVIRIGMTSGNTEDPLGLSYAETVILADIVAEDINQYVTNLGLDMTFEFVIKDNQGQAAIAWENTEWFKQNGIDLIIGHPYSSQCQVSLDYVNENNMLLLSGSSTATNLAIPNDRLFRACPSDGESNSISAEMWKSWGVDAVLTMQVDHWSGRFDDFEDELGIRGITSLGRIVYNTYDYEDDLALANETITVAIQEYGEGKVGIQFISWEEISDIQKHAATYPNLIDSIWMTITEQGYRNRLNMLDDEEFMLLATKTRHFTHIMRCEESFFLNQEFAEKFSEGTGYAPPLFAMIQYDACWLLAETIIKTGSTDAGVISTSLIPISHKMHGLSGWLALDENGDRIPQIYDISGFYEDEPGEYKVGTFGSYDGNTGEVDWDDAFLEETGITRPGK